MAVKSSGQLSITTDIVGEFGGSAPHALSEYKRGGSLVPDISANSDIPTTNSDIQFSDFYGAINTVSMTYEIIGAGGGGGAGDTSTVNGSDGGDSTMSYNNGSTTVTVTSSGGAGGTGGTQTGWGEGEDSYYGDGGASGISSDSSNQTAGSAPAATAYGAGGGGGGAHTFSQRNGGVGGYAGGTDGTGYTQSAWNSSATLQRYIGMPSTGTVDVVPNSTISITIGTGGAGGTGFTQGAKGADGYCKITIGGTDYIYTATGSHSLTVPS